jgi:hypothetical protein
MNANACTKKPEMKIGFHRLNTRHPKPLFIVAGRFDMDNFPVRVRHLRLTQSKMPETSSDTSSLDRRAYP